MENKTLKKQMDESFDLIKQGNKEELKINFLNSLLKLNPNLAKESKTPLISVGNLNDLDLESIESLECWNNLDDLYFEHKLTCKKCQKNKPCQELDDLQDNDLEITYEFRTNGKWIEDLKTKQVHSDGDFEIHLNLDSNTFQVLKSPITTKKGFCSPCYPNQCDLDSEGNNVCYDLPREYYTSEKQNEIGLREFCQDRINNNRRK